MSKVLTKSLSIRGFIVFEFAEQRPAFYAEMEKWIREGRVRYREDIVEGLENAPASFIGLLQGSNFGKLLVRVGT
jgi:NADPH-dependent curcumin reductase CurA